MLKTPIHKTRQLTPLEDFICGSFSGIITTVVGHPFDTVKVRMQTNTTVGIRITKMTSLSASSLASASEELAHVGALRIVYETIRTEGPFALFKGMSSPMLSIPLVNAIVFASYGQTKAFVRKSSDYSTNEPLSLSMLALCGAVAGFVSCFVVGPVELIRSRLQVQTIGRQQYRGPVDCAVSIIKQKGIFGLWRGMTATIVRDVPGYMAQFYVYEGLKKVFTPKPVKSFHGPNPPEGGRPTTPISGLLMAGGLGGVAGWAVTYPIDVLKSKIQVTELKGNSAFRRHRFLPDGGLIDGWKQTIAREGYKGLFRGFGPCMARAFPVNASAFFAYEFLSKQFIDHRKH